MGSSGGPGKIDNLNYGGQLESMAQANDRRGGNLFRTANPLYQEQVGQTLEALKTGGVGAQIPIIQRAVEQSRLGTSNALAQSADSLRGAGLSGTPFGQNILSNERQAGAMAASNIPTNYAQQFIAGAPGLSGQGFTAGGNYSQLGSQTLGNLQGQDLARQQVNALEFQDFMKALYGGASQGISAGSSAAACLHPNTPIETPAGDRLVSDLVVGDRVWTENAQGEIVEGRILEHQARKVGMDHGLALHVTSKGSFLVTPQHPLPDGSPIGNGAGVTEGLTSHTMDIKVDGPTGVYFVLGVRLGSTLDRRHRRAA